MGKGRKEALFLPPPSMRGGRKKCFRSSVTHAAAETVGRSRWGQGRRGIGTCSGQREEEGQTPLESSAQGLSVPRPCGAVASLPPLPGPRRGVKKQMAKKGGRMTDVRRRGRGSSSRFSLPSFPSLQTQRTSERGGIEGERSIRMGGQIFRAFFLPSRPTPSVFLPLHPFSAAIRPLLAFSFLRIPAGVGRRGSCTEADVSRRDYIGRSPSSSDTFCLSNCSCTFSLIVHVAPSVVPIGNFSTVCVTVLPLSSVEMVMVYSSSWLTMLSNTTS